MKLKKLIIISLVILFVFLTYFFFNDERLNYVSLGDSIARGQNPYGEIGYSYTDYLKDYLKSKNKLKDYTTYAVSGYKTIDIINDINNNKKINNKNIKQVLRESDLVTISIGANDFMKELNLKQLNLKNTDIYYKKIDNIFIDVDKTLNLIRKYAKNEIILVGYYNPFPILFNLNEKEIDSIFSYVDRKYNEVTNKYNCKYLSIYNLFKNNKEFLPNPFDIHPNLNGYKNISDLLINTYINNN